MPGNDDVYGTPPTPPTSDRFPRYYRPRLSSTLEFLILSAVVRVACFLLLEQIRAFQPGWKPRPRDVTRIPLVRYRYWVDPVSRSRERAYSHKLIPIFFLCAKIKRVLPHYQLLSSLLDCPGTPCITQRSRFGRRRRWKRSSSREKGEAE